VSQLDQGYLANDCPKCGREYNRLAHDFDLCIDCNEITHWSDLAALTHTTQLAAFNYCPCEDIGEREDTPYPDCPSDDGTLRHCGRVADWSDCTKCGAGAWCYRATCPACQWSSSDCEGEA
jgi:hypothetical protein